MIWRPRFTVFLILIASIAAVALFQATRMFRTEVHVQSGREFRTRFTWGYPTEASIKPKDMEQPRVKFGFYPPRINEIFAALIWLAPSDRFPPYERNWLVDWNKDGTFDLRIELERASQHPVLNAKGYYVRRSPGDGWREVTGHEADDVLNAVTNVMFGIGDSSPNTEETPSRLTPHSSGPESAAAAAPVR